MSEILKKPILIIDDDPEGVEILSGCLAPLQSGLEFAFNLNDGFEKLAKGDFDVVLLDANLPDGNGIDHIPHILDRKSPPLVIIMAALSDPDRAEFAINSGAWDYLQKPVSLPDVQLQVLRAMEFQRQKRMAAASLRFDAPEIIGTSLALQKCLGEASQMMYSTANVLITGETGTGKELFARAIHRNSSRCNKEFIVVDCSVLSESLIESVLFGHEKGAFTGADKNRKGLVALADGGTLFLDEVGELPPSMQSAFLRVLQDKTFRPLGSEKEVHSDFRVICATNKNLEKMADDGLFRTDLLYRLKTLTLNLPPLRDRRCDIWPISTFKIARTCTDHGIDEKEVAADFIESLERYDWPGNIRELMNTIETSVTRAQFEKTLFAFHLPSRIRAKIIRSKIGRPVADDLGRDDDTLNTLTHREAMDRVEKAYLESVFIAVKGDIRQMIARTALSRTVLYRKLKRYSIR